MPLVGGLHRMKCFCADLPFASGEIDRRKATLGGIILPLVETHSCYKIALKLLTANAASVQPPHGGRRRSAPLE